MSQVVGQSDRFGQIFIEAQLPSDGPADPSNFQCMSQPCAVVIVGLSDQDLGLVHQPAKSSRMDNPIAVALVQRPVSMRLLSMTAAPTLAGSHRIGSEELLLALAPVTRFEAGGI